MKNHFGGARWGEEHRRSIRHGRKAVAKTFLSIWHTGRFSIRMAHRMGIGAPAFPTVTEEISTFFPYPRHHIKCQNSPSSEIVVMSKLFSEGATKSSLHHFFTMSEKVVDGFYTEEELFGVGSGSGWDYYDPRYGLLCGGGAARPARPLPGGRSSSFAAEWVMWTRRTNSTNIQFLYVLPLIIRPSEFPTPQNSHKI